MGSFLEEAKRIDDCIGGGLPSQRFQEIRALLADADLRRYFFDRLSDPEWLTILHENGCFTSPPAEGRWPQAGYLARIAHKAAEPVRSILLGLPGVENPIVRAEMLQVLKAMPPSVAATLIDKVEPWVLDATGLLADEFAQLMSKFATGGEQSAALRIAKSLLQVHPAPRDRKPETRLLASMPETRLDLWNYEQILVKQVPELVKAAPLEALSLLCNLLSDAIRFSLRDPEKYAPSDVSHVWRPAVEEHEQNLLPELRSLLARAVRDAALEILKSGEAGLEQTIATLEGYKPAWRIFQRISLYLLSEFFDDPAAVRLSAERLTNRDLFDAPECIHEYVGLLQQEFPHLSLEQQREVLDWIEKGPLPDQLENLKRNLPQFTRRAVTQEDIERYKKTWRRDWLQRLGDHLPAEKRPELKALTAELGPREHPDLGSFRKEVMGSSSPLSLDEFKRKSVAEQVDLLREWEPSPGQFMGPSRTGLGEQLSKLVAENPSVYATEARRFEEVDPTYQRFLLNGFREAVDRGQSFDWLPVFKVCERILKEPLEILRPQRLPLEDDPDRTWCRNAVATLLETALRQKQVTIPVELKDELWKLLETISNDLNPTPDHEERYSGSNDPATLALNSTRGQAIHAVIHYAWWVRQSIATASETSKGETPPGFDVVPEARTVLETHLDTKTEPSLAIRAVYGQRFVWLWLIDSVWAKDYASRIFPVDKSQLRYWEAAWSSYLAFCQLYGDVFDGLRTQYALAVERLADTSALPRLPIDPKQRLAEHLVSLYWAGRIPDGVSDTAIWEPFWSHAPVEVRRHALWYLGRLLYDAKDAPAAETIVRLQWLWAQRLSEAIATGNSKNYAAEIAQFGWWFCSKKMPEDWALEQLNSALEFAGYADPDHFIFTALAEAAKRKPLEAIRCLEKLIAKANQWHLTAYERDLREVFLACKDAGGEASVIMARVVNNLARRDMLQFRDLVD